MKTFVAKADEINRSWLLIDAKEKTLGRLASNIATRLRGKNKPEYTPSVDTGDFVVVINVEQVGITGNKATDKVYYRHSGYPGGLKTATFNEVIARQPEQVLRRAVKGMLPKGPLGRQMMTKLKIYSGSEHPHSAQQPQKIEA